MWGLRYLAWEAFDMRALIIFIKWELRTLLFGQGDENRTKATLMSSLVALLLVGIIMTGSPPLKGPEIEIWEKVRSAQDFLYQERMKMGIPSDPDADPWKTGLIGVEWSSITTTLGDLRAKRTSTDPRWSVVFYRWFTTLGLKEKDSVAILTSGSFPGFALSAIVAAEKLGLDVLLVPSLGTSSWGANIPYLPITSILRILRSHGYVKAAPYFATLGGSGELGLDLPPEGIYALQKAAKEDNVTIISAKSFEELLELKWAKIAAFNPKAIVQIGGSQANLGTDPEVLTLQPGILRPKSGVSAGNGIIAKALNAEIPVIHMLNVKALCRKTGVPFDDEPLKKAPKQVSKLLSIVGLLLWVLYLFGFKRWIFEEEGSPHAKR